MLVFAAEENERIQYILEQLLGHQLGLNFKVTDNLSYFLASKATRINYANDIIEGVINIPAINILYESDIRPQKIEVFEDENWFKLFFKAAPIKLPDFKVETSYLPFDLLAASFFLLSRYEEYWVEPRDEHNRFKADSSIAYKNNFLKFPLIEHWLEEFKKKALKVYPSLTFKSHHYTALNTIDIDFAYKYKGRSKFNLFKKYVGSVLRFKPDIKIFEAQTRDPYDTYDYILDIASKKNIQTIFFFLLSDKGNYDTNINPKSPEAIELYNRLAESANCGIHPSYKASIDSKILAEEFDIFTDIIGKKPNLSRYHFLKLKLPESFNNLIKLGIESDYTLCYADQVGFRASTCRPFKGFDLHKNRSINLWLYSPCLMDVSLKNYLKLRPQEAINEIKIMREVTLKHKGKFISIWHNSSFDSSEDWKDWDKVYESIFD